MTVFHLLFVKFLKELMFLETSALTGENVEESFLKCSRAILNKIELGKQASPPPTPSLYDLSLPFSSYPFPSIPISSYPILFYSIPSLPIPSIPISSHLILSHPISSDFSLPHPIPSLPSSSNFFPPSSPTVILTARSRTI